MEEVNVAGFQFFANFDSGNLARIELDDSGSGLEERDAKSNVAETIKGKVESALEFTCEKPSEPPYDLALKAWTAPDCAGTEFQNGNRTWFYFGFKAVGSGGPKVLKISVMNLNKQSKLFSQGMVPIFKRVPIPSEVSNLSKAALKQHYPGTWERVRDKPSYRTNQDDDNNNNFVITFRIRSDPKAVTYVAFTFPYSYKELQAYLGRLERRYSCAEKSYEELSKLGSNSIYFHRENACFSIQRRRVDLLTVTGTNGIMEERESRLTNLFPDHKTVRPFKFANKRVVFVSARVHPGETQSSFVIDGFTKFLFRPTDPRAVALRRKYVFKIMPMLNPDGVYNGHYRTDIRGVNLNRVYAKPTFELYPSISAARKLLLYAHRGSELEDPPADGDNDHDDGDDASLAASKDKKVDDESNFTEPLLRARRDASRSIEILSDPLRWLRCSAAAAADSEPSPSCSVVHNWYEMTETSRCSEGDESIADFSIHHPNNLHPSSTPPSSRSVNPTSVSPSKRLLDRGSSADVPKLSFAGALSSSASPSTSVADQNLDRQPLKAAAGSGNSKDASDDSGFAVVGGALLQGAEEENANLEFASSGGQLQGSLTKDGCSKRRRPSAASSPTTTSGMFLYVDVHGHASKRGIFMYGNHFAETETKVAAMLLPKLMSVNCANFDFPGCNFTERNMYLKDRHTGAGREGSGRVSVFKATGLVQSYTLECNFNSGRVVNHVPMASRDSGRATPPLRVALADDEAFESTAASIPNYNPEVYEDAGKQMAISILDLTDSNPWTRLTCSAYKNLKGVKDWLRKYIKQSQEQQSKVKSSPSSKTLTKSPVRSLRSTTRRIRTFSATSVASASGASVSKRSGRGKKGRGGSGSPVPYVPVSKIARKGTLNQQQSSPGHHLVRCQQQQQKKKSENGSSLMKKRSKLLVVEEGGGHVQASPPGSRKKKKQQLPRAHTKPIPSRSAASIVLNRRSSGGSAVSPPAPKVLLKRKSRPKSRKKYNSVVDPKSEPVSVVSDDAKDVAAAAAATPRRNRTKKGKAKALAAAVNVDGQFSNISPPTRGSSSGSLPTRKQSRPKRSKTTP